MPTWLAIVLGIVGGVGAASGVWWNLREKSARARLAPALEAIGRDRDEDGRVLVFETAMSRVNYELRVSNEGRKAAGRTEVVVWVPRAAEVRWASDGSGSELSGGPRPMPSEATLTTASGDEHPAVELRRSLDAIPRIGETLYLRISSEVPFGGHVEWPVKVRIRGDGAGDAVERTYVLRWVHRAP